MALKGLEYGDFILSFRDQDRNIHYVRTGTVQQYFVQRSCQKAHNPQDVLKLDLDFDKYQWPAIEPQPNKLFPSIMIGTIITLVVSGVSYGILYGTTILQDSVLQVYEAAIISIVSAAILGAVVAGIYHTYANRHPSHS